MDANPENEWQIKDDSSILQLCDRKLYEVYKGEQRRNIKFI